MPLTYRLGQLDSHFSITRDEAVARLAEAEKVWEDRVGRDLFVYDEAGTLVVDFVFDDRQAEADKEGASRKVLDEQFLETEKIKKTIEDLQKEYGEKSKTYEAEFQAYEKALMRHNDRVTRQNDQGGAAPEVYAALEKERQVLDQRLVELNTDAAALNAYADDINALGQKSNELVERYNQAVEVYNAEYGFSKEFTQGDYQDGTIHIYTFSSPEELVAVLMHEFGHALGMDHVDDESSVMYYLLTASGSVPTLSSADMAAFRAVCGTGNERVAKVRRLIREFIHHNFK